MTSRMLTGSRSLTQTMPGCMVCCVNYALSDITSRGRMIVSRIRKRAKEKLAFWQMGCKNVVFIHLKFKRYIECTTFTTIHWIAFKWFGLQVRGCQEELFRRQDCDRMDYNL